MTRPMWRPLAASALAYAAITLLMGRDVLANLSTAIAADRGDPILNAGILAWNARNVPLSDAWFDFPSFFPATGVLTLSEHLLGLSVVATPVYWLSQDAVTTYNVTLLTTYVLSGVSMFVLVWYLTGHPVASFLAGLAYAFAPYRAAHLGHIQVLAVFWAPLALMGLHAFVRTGRRPWLVLFGIAWLLQGAANGYVLVFFTVFVGFWVLWFALGRGRWRETALIGVAGLVAVLPLAPILSRYADVHAGYMLSRSADEVARYSADITSIACAVPRLPVWGWFGAGVCGGEQELFPGLTVVVMCLAAGWVSRERGRVRTRAERVAAMLSGLCGVAGFAMVGAAATVAMTGPWTWRLGLLGASASTVREPFTRGVVLLVLAVVLAPAVWRAARRASIPAFYLLMALVMWAFTWGPAPLLHGRKALEAGPYAWLMLLPGVDELRVPARFWTLTVLCLCVASGVLIAAALRRRGARAGVLVAVLAGFGVMLDGWAPIPAVGLVPPAPRPDLLTGGVALTLPLGAYLDRDAGAQLEAVQGGWVAANGYSGYEPPHYELLREASKEARDMVLSPFLARGDLNVVIFESWPEQDALVAGHPGATLVGRGNGLRQYRIPRRGTVPRSEPTGTRMPVVAVSASCFEDDARLALDGDSATRWRCGPQAPGQALTADLGAVGTVGEVVPALGPSPEYPRDLVVETSRDGITWEGAWRRGVLPEAFEALVRDPRMTRLVLSFAPREARFIRLRLPEADDRSLLSIAELEVWSGR